MKNSLAPVILFVYKRLLHTQQTVEALKKNELSSQSELFIYSDGAKNDADEEQVNEVRTYLRSIDGFKSVKIIERQKNWGLAANIIDGVTEIINQYDKAIVLEDDLVTSPFFLRYMNEALITYHDDSRVGCIHGYIYPIDNIQKDFFIKGSDCWGWAAWKRSWSFFEKDGAKLLEQVTESGIRKDPYHVGCGYVQMLEDQISGKNNSWAIRWYFSSLINDLYCLYPGVSYVNNIGLDDSGTHCDSTVDYYVKLQDKYEFTKIDVLENYEYKQYILDFFKGQESFLDKVKKYIKRFFR